MSNPKGDVHAGAGVGRAWPAGDHTQARAAGDLAMGLGHHRGAALLAAHDGLDAVGVMQAVDNCQIALARHPKGDLHLLRLQGFHQ